MRFANKEEAEAAVEEINNTEFFDKTITVEVSKRKKARTKTPGRYLGKFKNRRSS